MLLTTDNFVWNKQTRTLVAEASTLNLGLLPLSFEVRSIRTGNTLRFDHARTEYDAEGDVAAEHYVGGDLKAVIFND